MKNKLEFFKRGIHGVWLVMIGAILSPALLIILFAISGNTEFLVKLNAPGGNGDKILLGLFSLPLVHYVNAVIEGRGGHAQSLWSISRFLLSIVTTGILYLVCVYVGYLAGFSLVCALVAFVSIYLIHFAGMALGGVWRKILLEANND